MTIKPPDQTQQAFLHEVKAKLGLTWEELAEASGIKARALKTYRMPDDSKDHRALPALARRALLQVLAGAKPAHRSKNGAEAH